MVEIVINGLLADKKVAYMVNNVNNEAWLKTSRVLSIFKRLINGEVVQKATEAKRFGVSEKTIQRDIEDIREYLAEEQKDGKYSELIWSPVQKGYIMTNSGEEWLEKADILAIAKVLLESRAFCKSEMEALLNKLLLQVSPAEKQHIKEIIRNEKFHYEPLQHEKALIDTLWVLSKAMREQWMVQLQYKKENSDHLVIRVVEPQGIIFSEYYFYLVARINNASYDFPAIYRIDRIQELSVLPEHYVIAYCNRFEEGEFCKRVQFMYSGPLLRIRFKYWGRSLDAVMDRLPTARVVSNEGNISVFEAEVYGRGIKMWLLSQAEYLEVVEPEEFREEMKRTINEMSKNYN